MLFFATLRDRTGVKETTLEFPPGTRIADLKAMVLAKYPGLKPHMELIIVAMNHEFAADEELVRDKAEIAMFPPVSGGDEPESPPTIAKVTEQAINLDQIVAQITRPTTGGICVFTGVVRGITQRGEAHETLSLEYEAYREMAEGKMRQIIAEMRQRWSQVEGIAMVQRLGKMQQGEVTVVVACAASHRDQGIFEAARYGIDRLKEIVPVWKKEITREGEAWVEGEYLPREGD